VLKKADYLRGAQPPTLRVWPAVAPASSGFVAA
jgi:hypothetical protein